MVWCRALMAVPVLSVAALIGTTGHGRDPAKRPVEKLEPVMTYRSPMQPGIGHQGSGMCPAGVPLSLSKAAQQDPGKQPPPKAGQDRSKLPPSQKKPAEVFQPLTEEQEKTLREEPKRYTPQPLDEPDPMDMEELGRLSEDERRTRGILPFPGGGYLERVKGRPTRVVVPGFVGINSGVIEVFATLGPKDHESILRLRCDIQVLDLTLSSALGLERGRLPEHYGREDPTDGSRVLVFVHWKKKGEWVTWRAEDLIIDMKRHQLFPRVGWLYLGGWQEKEHPITKKREKMLRAAVSKLAITTFRDPWSLVDNVLKDEDATDDYYAANMFVLPEPGTEVMVSFRKPTKKELQTIKKIEREFYP